MKILALDTATENCSAALLVDGNVESREIEKERGHAELILPMVDDLLSHARLTLADLDAVAFGRGPGSFTGARLAATVTQGLAFGANLGVVPISDLQAVAQRAFTVVAPTPAAASASPSAAAPVRVLVCNDARMSEVYWACFERDPSTSLAKLTGEEHVSKPTDVRLPRDWTAETTLGAGRGFRAYAEALQAAVPLPNLSATLTDLLPRATEIALLSVPEVAAGRLHPPEAATPIYLRDNVAHVAHPLKPAK